MYDSFCITDIKFCDLEYIKNYLNSIDTLTIIVISKTSADRFNFSNLILNKKFICIDNFHSNPTQIDIVNALDKIKVQNKKIDNIIAIGGGSAIDLAKSIIAFYSYEDNYSVETITNKIINKNYNNNDINLTAIPTTAGTGSEVTQWATIWDHKNNKKYSIDAKYLQPKQALICTDLTLTMPKRLILSTALDALSHSIEAFWAKSTNAISKELSIRAIDLIVDNLEKALNDTDNFKYREKLFTASLLAGISFSKTRTTACHSISYPLTSMFGIEHGFAVAMTLYEVFEINKECTKDIDIIINIFNNHGGLKNWLNTVCEGIVELRLSYFGIKEDDINSIVQNSFTAGRIDNNPANISKDLLFNILNNII